MAIDPWILTFSAATVIATIWMGFWAAKKSKTASDFFVAGRSVSVGWNASAISGEYLSAASFMGVAGMVMSSGYDALWYPVCYACGYLFLLLFIAGPLRRFGAYTIPDFAEGRFDSPLFRKIAIVFVLFIGFFYTMPQMKGAGTTLAYIFPGLPYWAGVVLVGVVITFNVALGGMRGITLVQAFQYWLKMFAISVPVFVLMAVYGHYGEQLKINNSTPQPPAADRFTASGVTRLDPSASATAGARDAFIRIEPGRPWFARLAAPIFARFDGKRAVVLNHTNAPLTNVLRTYAFISGKTILLAKELEEVRVTLVTNATVNTPELLALGRSFLAAQGVSLLTRNDAVVLAVPTEAVERFANFEVGSTHERKPLPTKAPADATWLNPFGPLTTKAAKATAAALTNQANVIGRIPLRADLAPDHKMTVNMSETNVTKALATYAELIGRTQLPRTNSLTERVDDLFGARLSRWHLVRRDPRPPTGIFYHRDGLFSAIEVKEALEALFRTNGIVVAPQGRKYFRAIQMAGSGSDAGKAIAALQKTWLQAHERPLALLYTYSLIIALVCGTAGLPHILVRFYTNPDGVAAKRTTMWVMILIGVFYLFPPVFGVMGRNLLPDLYTGAGAKGTDKIVLELPKVLDSANGVSAGTPKPAGGTPALPEQSQIANRKSKTPWGSILSGITCAGAFAAFMSTFSGLLVSMTGALAHDIYGRILRPQSTPDQRMRAFRYCAVIIGAIAIALGMQVEPFQINFMVGQAFAIAAASYFPLLFVSCWWRGLTMKGAATGMLTGGLLALAGITLTSFSDLAMAGGPTAKVFAVFKPLDSFWVAHPLLRILCEQPALWTVPLAIGLMVVVSKLTRPDIPPDIRMKMLVLHAPEKLGLKQEYIQEHQHGH